MNKNNLEETKKLNIQSRANVNSSINEQAIATTGTSNADMSSITNNTNYSTFKKTEKENTKTDAVRDITKNLR